MNKEIILDIKLINKHFGTGTIKLRLQFDSVSEDITHDNYFYEDLYKRLVEEINEFYDDCEVSYENQNVNVIPEPKFKEGDKVFFKNVPMHPELTGMSGTISKSILTCLGNYIYSFHKPYNGMPCIMEDFLTSK